MNMKKLSLLAMLVAELCIAQTATAPPSSSAAPYLKPNSTPMSLRGPLAVLGDRVQVHGKERFTLAGTYTDTNGSGNQAIQIIWELPGKVRINLPGRTIIYDGTTTKANGAAPSASDEDLIESLADDRPETLLFALRQPNFAWRFLGGWFRIDNGVNKNYSGPFFTVHETVGTVPSRPDNPRRHKLVLFDSHTAFFVETKYDIDRSGSSVEVETVWTGWSNVTGQAIPTKIVRRENGTDVITINLSSGQVSPTANDGLFVNP